MNSNENWELKIDEAVYKELKKFPKNYADKILHDIDLLSIDPYFGDIQKIKDEEDVWRKRVGAYRIFYEIHKAGRVIHVFWVERRSSKTY